MPTRLASATEQSVLLASSCEQIAGWILDGTKSWEALAAGLCLVLKLVARPRFRENPKSILGTPLHIAERPVDYTHRKQRWLSTGDLAQRVSSQKQSSTRSQSSEIEKKRFLNGLLTAEKLPVLLEPLADDEVKETSLKLMRWFKFDL